MGCLSWVQFKFWIMFCLCHNSALCDIILNHVIMALNCNIIQDSKETSQTEQFYNINSMIFWNQPMHIIEHRTVQLKAESVSGFSKNQLWAVLEIPTGPPVRGRQLWRRTGNFLLIFLQFYVYDLRSKAWGPTTFLTEFQTLVARHHYFLHPLTNLIVIFHLVTSKLNYDWKLSSEMVRQSFLMAK